MNTMTISGGKDHEFAGEWGEVYGSIWREDREGTKFVIKL